MAERDSQPVVLSRQSILLVTAVGVGLLTLCYVLGVQVGKQSAALSQPTAKGSGENLDELPATLDKQLKNLEGLEQEKPQQPQPVATSKPEEHKAEAEPETVDTPKSTPTPKPDTAQSKPKPTEAPAKSGDHWTAQLVSTSDAAEANRVAAKAKAAGFAASTLKEKGSIKVRLTRSGKRADVDAAITKLKAKGLHAFAVKAD